MIPELYQDVSLMHDLPEYQLRKGDTATLVDYVPHPSGGEQGCVLELFNAAGESVDVVTVPLSAIAPIQSDRNPPEQNPLLPLK